MNDSSKEWIPAGLPPGVGALLSVTNPGQPMTLWLYRQMLAAKLDGLIQSDPKEARRAMEMSQEHAPELWQIAHQYPINQWAEALVRSDQMTSLLSSMTGKGTLADPSPVSLLEILEQLA